MSGTKRIIVFVLAAVLFSGCSDDDRASDISELPVINTTSASIKYPEYTTVYNSAPEGELPEQGYTALESFFSGADEYCDVDELGAEITVRSGFLKEAKRISQENEDFDPNFDGRRFDSCIGVEDGRFYFSVLTTYRKADADGFYQQFFRDDYFCINCYTGELEQVFPPEGYDDILAMGNSFMLCEGADGYVVADCVTGEVYVLDSPHITDCFFVGDKLFFATFSIDDSISDIRWADVDNGSLYVDVLVPAREGVYYSAERGVYNLVYRGSPEHILYSLNGTEYLDFEVYSRLRDYVTQTYYPCTAAVIPNRIGCNIRFYLTDRDGMPHVLGNMFTDVSPSLMYEVDIHATESGLVYLQKSGFEPILLRLDMSGRDHVSAAFVPEGVIPEYCTVLCDGDRLYFYNSNANDTKLVMIEMDD